MKSILYYSRNKDLKEILKYIKNSSKVNFKTLKEIKILLKKIKNSKLFISDDSIEGEILSLIFKIILKKKTILWIDEYKKYPYYQYLYHVLSKNKSDKIITRSKQIKFLLDKKKRNVHVVYPWIKERSYIEKKVKNNIYINTKIDIKIPANLTQVDSLDKADISILEYDKNILKIKMPKEIFKSVENRITTIIVCDNIKLVNKLFKGVKNIYALKPKDIDFNYIEYLVNKNYSFKVPKKYRMKYNISIFKKIISN